MTTTIRSLPTSGAIAVNGVDQVTIKETGQLTVRTAGSADDEVCKMGQSKLKQSATVNTTSGTFIEFSGIPAWAKRVTLAFLNLSTNGTSPLLVHLGGAVYQATGYSANASIISGATATGGTPSTAGFPLSGGAAVNVISGSIDFVSLGGGFWVGKGVFAYGNANANGMVAGGVLLTGPGILERVRIGTVNGSDTFDGGSANITWE